MSIKRIETVEIECRCDICDDKIHIHRALGVGFNSLGKLVEKPAADADRQLCRRCVSSIQHMAPICGEGIRGCLGGPDCSYDHK